MFLLCGECTEASRRGLTEEAADSDQLGQDSDRKHVQPEVRRITLQNKPVNVIKTPAGM